MNYANQNLFGEVWRFETIQKLFCSCFKVYKTKTTALAPSWGYEGWNQLTACLNSSSLNRPKKLKLHIDFSGISEQIKPLQPVGQAAKVKFET